MAALNRLPSQKAGLPSTATSPARWLFLASTLVGFGLVAAGILGQVLGASGLDLRVAAAALLAWGALSTIGVFFPWLQMYGPVLSRGPRGQGEVALTFDDGPHPVTTRRVLDILRATPHRATFFVLADKVKRHPDVIREIHANGHSLALHGAFHDRLHSFRGSARVERELREAQGLLAEVVGYRTQLFRPPLGHTSPLTMRAVSRLGLCLVGWSCRGYDGLSTRTPDQVLSSVLSTLDDGAIILLHDAAERDDFEPASLHVLSELLRQLEQRGLRSVGLNTWLQS